MDAVSEITDSQQAVDVTINWLLSMPIKERYDNVEKLSIATKTDAGRFCANLLRFSSVTSTDVAVDVLAAGEPLLVGYDDGTLLNVAKQLAAELAGDDPETAVDDCVFEPFRFFAWSIGLHEPWDEAGEKRLPPRPFSNFDNAAERDARKCPLRAAEVAIELMNAVASFAAHFGLDVSKQREPQAS
jgi:hypothetical protein